MTVGEPGSQSRNPTVEIHTVDSTGRAAGAHRGGGGRWTVGWAFPLFKAGVGPARSTLSIVAEQAPVIPAHQPGFPSGRPQPAHTLVGGRAWLHHGETPLPKSVWRQVYNASGPRFS